MARHSRLDVLCAILDTGLVPTFQHEDAELAVPMAEALVKGGARVIEFLNRGDTALAVFDEVARMRRTQAPEVALGIGSIVDPPTAALYLAHGADFVVGPTFHPRIARLLNRRKVAYIPGCGTPSEISAAEAHGCEIVKLFPASALDGPEFIRSLRAPMPWARVMPTGNAVRYSEEEVGEWVDAGACAIGTGLAVFDAALVAGRQWDAIALRVRTLLKWVRDSRESRRARPASPPHESPPPSGRGA